MENRSKKRKFVITKKRKIQEKNGNFWKQKNGKKAETITPGCRVAYPATKKSWETIRFLAMFEKTGSFLDHFSLLY